MFWFFATPIAMGMGGYFFWWPLWGVLGLWGVHRRYILRTLEEHPGLPRDRWRAVGSTRLTVWIFYHAWPWVFSAAWGVNLSLLSWIVAKTLGWQVAVWAVAGAITVGAVMWWRRGRWRFPWWIMLGPAAYGALQLDEGYIFAQVTMSMWAYCVIVLLLGGWLRMPKSLVWAAWANWFFGAFFMEFYVAPYSHEVERVTAQPGVTLIRADANLDFRWAQEGCRPGEFWMGTRRMMGFGNDRTTLQRNGQGYRIGKGTADNGEVDCALHLVMVGDQDSENGRLSVLDESSGKILWQTPRRKGREWGYTAVVYDAASGTLLGSMENASRIDWVTVKQIPKVRHRTIAEPATHLEFCSRFYPLCFFSANQSGVRRHDPPAYAASFIRSRYDRSAGPILALDEARRRLYVSDFFSGDITVLDARNLRDQGMITMPMGVRYLKWWPRRSVLLASDFFSGKLYAVDRRGRVKPFLFTGRKTRWINLTRDGKGLLWCAAAACYEWRENS